MALNKKGLDLIARANSTEKQGSASSAKKVKQVKKTKDYCKPIPFSLPESLVKNLEEKIMEIVVEMAKEGIHFKTSQSKVVAEILRYGLNDKRSWESIKENLKSELNS